MLIPILEFQNRKYVVPNKLDAGKIVALLAELVQREVSMDYVSGKGYEYTIQPTPEVEVSLTYVDQSRVKFPTLPPVTAIENTPS